MVLSELEAAWQHILARIPPTTNKPRLQALRRQAKAEVVMLATHQHDGTNYCVWCGRPRAEWEPERTPPEAGPEA